MPGNKKGGLSNIVDAQPSEAEFGQLWAVFDPSGKDGSVSAAELESALFEHSAALLTKEQSDRDARERDELRIVKREAYVKRAQGRVFPAEGVCARWARTPGP